MKFISNLIFLTFLSSISSLSTVLLFCENINAQQNNLLDNKKLKIPEFYAIQHAQSGSFTKLNNSLYSLELNNVSDRMILFSDNKDGLIKSIKTADFINKWIEKSDDLQFYPANVELVLDLKYGQKSFFIELLNPVYHKQNKLLKYDILLNDSKTSLESHFGEVTLVIDSILIDPRYLSNHSNQISIENNMKKETGLK